MEEKGTGLSSAPRLSTPSLPGYGDPEATRKTAPGRREKGHVAKAYPVEGLRHLPQEVLGHLHTLVHGQVEVGVSKVLLDPSRQLPTLVGPSKPL